MTIFEEFLRLFHDLKNSTGDNPARVPWLWKESKRVQEIGNDLYTLTHVLEYRLARSGKLIGPVPAVFNEEFKNYQQHYEEKIIDAKFPPLDLEDFARRLREEEDEASPSVVPTNETVDGPTEARTEKDQEESEERFPDIEVDEDGVSWIAIQGESEKRFVIDEFEPEYHDAYEEFKGIVDYARDRFESAMKGGYDDAGLMNVFRRGVEAFDYYRDTIGVDLEGIGRRWKQIPHTFVPRHVSDAQGLTERSSLYDLHQEAVRAYVFGAPTAALAMCRSLCEDLLKRHYGLETKKNKRGYDPPFGKIIDLAEGKYEWIKKLKLGSKVEGVNSLLHRYDRATMMTTADEKLIVEFLATAKMLIEGAPLQHDLSGKGTRGNA